MSWFRVDDTLPAHVKLESLEADPLRHALAVAAWTLLGADSAGRGTDGLITPARIAKVLHCWPVRYREKACEALVCCGLWERASAESFQFHDWTDYQPTKEQREHNRAATRERQKAWKAKRRVSNGVTDSVTDSVSDSVSNAAPSRPVPSRSPTEGEPPTDIGPAHTLSRVGEFARLTVSAAYAARRLAPPPEAGHLDGKHWIALARWLLDPATAVHGTHEQALASLLTGFFASKRAEERGYPVAFLATVNEYLPPPRTVESEADALARRKAEIAANNARIYGTRAAS